MNTRAEAGKTVAVIGAGIVGVATALWLQRAGHDVVLVDRTGPAAGASFGNGGVLASAGVVPVTVPGMAWEAPRMLLSRDGPLFVKWRYLPRMLPWLVRFQASATAAKARHRAKAMTALIGDSLADHQALAAGTGAERWVVPCDYVYLYRDRAELEADSFGWSLRRDCGFRSEVLEGAAARGYDPCFGPEVGCAVRLPDHGRISDPGAYVTALAAQVARQGGCVLTAEVTDLVREGGCVTGLRLGGETLPCDAAVLTAGAWSGPLAAKLGLNVPLETERGYHLDLWEPSAMPRAPVMIAAAKTVATPMEGRLRLAGIVEFGGLDAPPPARPSACLNAASAVRCRG